MDTLQYILYIFYHLCAKTSNTDTFLRIVKHLIKHSFKIIFTNYKKYLMNQFFLKL